MKKSYFKLSFILLVMFVLVACSSNSNADKISIEEEFTEYRNTIIEPLNEKSLKIAEMGGHFASIIEDSEDASNYLDEELIPYVKEAREVAVDVKDSLVNEEIKQLNDILIKNFDLTIESFTKTSDITKLTIPPISDPVEAYEKAEKINNELQELQIEIDSTSAEFDAGINELSGK